SSTCWSAIRSRDGIPRRSLKISRAHLIACVYLRRKTEGPTFEEGYGHKAHTAQKHSAFFCIPFSEVPAMYQRIFKVGFRLACVLSLAALGTAAGGDARLADAAMRLDRDAVRSLLQQKADVNGGQPDGTTALHWAVRQDDLETAQTLIRAGAKAD